MRSDQEHGRRFRSEDRTGLPPRQRQTQGFLAIQLAMFKSLLRAAERYAGDTHRFRWEDFPGLSSRELETRRLTLLGMFKSLFQRVMHYTKPSEWPL